MVVIRRIQDAMRDLVQDSPSLRGKIVGPLRIEIPEIGTNVYSLEVIESTYTRTANIAARLTSNVKSLIDL
jgi:hypothetical protein